VAFLEWLMPRDSGDRLGDVMEAGFGQTLSAVLADLRVRRLSSLDVMVIAGGIAGLALPFGILHTPTIPVVAFIAVGAIAMGCRDAWIQPAQGTFGEALMDALVVAWTLVGSELVFMLVAPALLMPAGIFIPALVAGVVIASGCRLTAHRNQPSSLARKNQALRPFWRAAVIILLWWGACLLLQYVNVDAVPGGEIRDFFIMPATMVCLPMALKLQGNSLSSLWWDPPVAKKQLADRLPQEMEKKEDMLDWSGKDFQSQMFQILFFVLLASLPAQAVWYKLTGAKVIVDWRQVFIDFAALIALASMWGEIKRISTDAAEQIREARRNAIVNDSVVPNANG
jgi:hypothetical protein